MGMNWCEDRIHDMIMDLDKIDDIWELQCTKEPTIENAQRIEKALKHVKTQIENAISDLQQWGP